MEMFESEKQLEYINRIKDITDNRANKLGRELTYCVVTFGCQMNANDSEKLRGVLERSGFVTAPEGEADFVIFNTCTVRENANTRLYGRLGQLKPLKKKRPELMIALCGCMMQETPVIEKIKKSYPFVDLIFGTHNIYKFAELLYESLNSKNTVIDIWDKPKEIVEELPQKKTYSFKSGVNIMFGCDNFCSYCIVPYVRGRERSRKPEDILNEIKELADNGVVEVMLLGQNVNSYGKTLDFPMSFAQLLKGVEKIDGIKRIRFMTSHPKDLSDELISVMSKSDKICRHLHLPLQSGSTRVLKAMNRKYTKEDYLKLVDKLRQAMPDIALTTDIIVGFPGETDEDFEETLDVIRKAGFTSAFTFIYSKRTGTAAAAMENQISADIVKNRFDKLLKVIGETATAQCEKFIGETFSVLAETVSDHDQTMLTGRLDNNLQVHFTGGAEFIGKFCMVRLTKCKSFYYFGEMVSECEVASV